MRQQLRSRSLFASATTLALVLAVAATPALAATGSVYFDTNGNAAAGGTVLSRGREQGPLKTAADAAEKEVQDTYGSKRGIGGTMMKRLRVALISGVDRQ